MTKVKRTTALCAVFAALLAMASLVSFVGGKAADDVDLSGVTRYGMADLTYGSGSKARDLFTGNGSPYIGNFPGGEKTNAAFQTRVVMKTGGNTAYSGSTTSNINNCAPFVNFGIFMNTAENFWSDNGSENGYLLTIDERYGLAIGRNLNGGLINLIHWPGNAQSTMFWDEATRTAAIDYSNANNGDDADISYDTAIGNESYAPAGLRDAIYDPDGFALEFGAKDCGDCDYVYVKINDEIILSYENSGTRPAGSAVSSTSFNHATLIDGAGVTADETPVASYGLADLAGAVHTDGIRDINAKGPANLDDHESGAVGNLGRTNNVEFTTDVVLSTMTKDFLSVAILQSGDINDWNWYGGAAGGDACGYILSVNGRVGNTDRTLPGIALGVDGNRAGDSDLIYDLKTWEKYPELYEELYAPTGFKLTFGARDYKAGDQWVYTYVYVKINGKTVLCMYDANTKPAGTTVAVRNYSRALLFDAEPETLTANDTAVVDMYDFNGVRALKDYTGLLGNFGGTSDSAVKMRVNLTDMNQQDVYKVGIFMKDAVCWYNGGDDGRPAYNGYFLTIDAKDGSGVSDGRSATPGMAIGPSANNGSNSDWWYTRLDWADNAALCDEMFDLDGFELEFGAADWKLDGTLLFTGVYVKVNGRVVLYAVYTGERPTGKSVAVAGGLGAWSNGTWGTSPTLCDISTTRTFSDEGSTAGQVTVYDYYRLAGKIKTVTTYTRRENLASFADEVTGNAAFTAGLTLLENARGGDTVRTLGILQESSDNGTWDGGGYWFVMTNTALRLSAGEHWAYTLAETDDATVLNKIYSGNRFIIEFGAQDFTDAEGNLVYTLVYVAIDGQTVLEYEDYFTARPKGSAINGLLSDVTVETTQNLTAEEGETEVYDVADFAGRYVQPHYAGPLGSFTDDGGSAVRMKVDLTQMTDTYDVYKVGIYMSNTGNWYNSPNPNGFMLTVDTLAGFHDPATVSRAVIPGMAIGLSGNNGSNSDDPFVHLAWADNEALYNKVFKAGGIVLEFGTVDYRYQGVLQYVNVYVKVDGEEVISFLYYDELPTGKGVAVGGKGSSFHEGGRWGQTSHTDVDLYSADGDYELTYDLDAVKTVDWLDATGRPESDFAGQPKDEYAPLGDLGQNTNVALRFRMTVSPDLQESVQMYFFLGRPVNNEVWDANKFGATTGYQVELGVSGSLAGGTMDNGELYVHGYSQLIQLGEWYGDTAHRVDMFEAGHTYLVEMGIAEAFINGERVGNYVFVKVDGQEALGFVDYTVNPYNGHNVQTMCTDKAERGMIVYSTAKKNFTVTHSNEALDLPASQTYYVEQEQDTFTLNIPVKVGYIATGATYGGQEIDLVETAGGYQAVIPTTDGELAVTAEARKLTVTLPTGDGATYETTAENGGVGYRGSLTVTITPPENKTLTSLTVGGENVMADVRLTNGRYVLTIARVTEDITIAAQYADVTYAVTAETAENGTVSLSAASVAAGGSVTVTVTPAEGYVLQSLTVNGTAVSVHEDGTYTIDNIYGDQTVKAVFVQKQVTQPAAKKGCGGAAAGSLLGLSVLTLIAAGALLARRRKSNG